MKIYYRIRFLITAPCFIIIGSKNNIIFIIDIFFIELEIHCTRNDMWIESEENIDGKRYIVHSKNPKYKNDEFISVTIPGWDKFIQVT